ncbi:hypothetical protein QS257_14930 [Terrilactibacillus sp. S3-3]|nr:hypothetical protein QS257_14930 [Terrilactibacillus sp. S3-3]
MDEQKQSLNYARLVNRQKFYKEKSLKLEKDFIFAQEKLSTLEKELKTLQEQSKTADQESKILQTEFSSLKTNYDALLDKYNQEKKKNAEKLADYEQRMEMLEKNQRADDDMSRETYAQRVAGYERLLTDMQNEMSEREKKTDRGLSAAHYRLGKEAADKRRETCSKG